MELARPVTPEYTSLTATENDVFVGQGRYFDTNVRGGPGLEKVAVGKTLRRLEVGFTIP